MSSGPTAEALAPDRGPRPADLGATARTAGTSRSSADATVVEVHPRIAGRRDQVAEAGRRKRRRVRWAGVTIATLLTAGVAMLFSPLFDLDRLEIVGVEGGPEAEVRAAAGLDDHTALFGIRPAEVRSRIEELAWVAHAEVEVFWPDRVEMEVSPHRPVAVLAGEGAEPEVIVTSSRHVLRFEDAGPLVPFAAGVPVLRVDDVEALTADAQVLAAALAMLGELRPLSAATVAEARLEGDGRMVLVAGPGAVEGAELLLGSLSEAPQKATALEAMLSGAVELSCVTRIDVSVPSRVTLEREPVCAAGLS